MLALDSFKGRGKCVFGVYRPQKATDNDAWAISRAWRSDYGQNAEWEVVKFLGGSGAMTAIYQVIRAAIRRDPQDWVLWGVVFLTGLILAVVGYRKERRKHPSAKLRDTAEAEEPPLWAGYESEQQWRQSIAEQKQAY